MLMNALYDISCVFSLIIPPENPYFAPLTSVR